MYQIGALSTLAAAAGSSVSYVKPHGALYDGINKSTATHHFRILREAGVTERVVIDGLIHQLLRRDAVDTAFPGLLDSIAHGANAESNAG